MQGKRVFAALLCAALLLPSAANAQQGDLPDVVETTDGTMIRGLIVERTPNVVVIRSASGELHRFATSRVAYAGPARTTAGRGATTGRAGPASGVRLRLSSTPSDLGVLVHRGQSRRAVWGRGMVITDRYVDLCDAPCEVVVPPGRYRFSVRDRRGDIWDGRRSVRVRRPTHVHLRLTSRRSVRVALALTGVGMLAVGAALFARGFDTGSDPLDRNYNTALLAAGGTLLSVGVIFPVAAFWVPRYRVDMGVAR